MDGAPAILTFERVTIESGPLYDSGIWDVSLTLNPGDLILLRLEKEHLRLPLADAASGLADPAEGRILFAGKSWTELSAGDSARQRASIGRVFEDGGWISSMDVDENILLGQRHHSGRPDKQIMDEAAHLARLFGLPGLPRGSPARTRRRDLSIAACVRAFLGEPILLLLENPTADVYSELMPGLMRAIRVARDRGAAVLWLTADSRTWTDSGIRPTRRCMMSGSQLLT